MELTREHYITLRGLLCDTLRDKDLIRIYCGDVGLPTTRVPWERVLEVVWYEVLEEARRDGVPMLPRLLARCVKAAPVLAMSPIVAGLVTNYAGGGERKGFHTKGHLPPDSQLFRGRSEELAQLEAICTHRSEGYAMLLGSGQSGKTSLLVRLQTRLKEDDHNVVSCLVDFQGVTKPKLLPCCAAICSQAAEALNGAGVASLAPQLNSPDDMPRMLSELLLRHERLSLSLLLEELGDVPKETLLKLASLIRFMFSNRYDPRFRALSRLKVVISGGVELDALSDTYNSPLNNVCTEVFLRDLEQSEAVGLVNAVLCDCGHRSVAGQVGERVFHWVKGHPHLTQVLGEFALEALISKPGVDIQVLLSEIDSHAARLAEDSTFVEYLRRKISALGLWEAVASVASPSGVRFSLTDYEVRRLYLLGLVGNEGGKCSVRNRLLTRAVSTWISTKEMHVPLVYVGFHGKDKALQQELRRHFAPRVTARTLRVWDRSDLELGERVDIVPSEKRQEAKAAVLIVSSHYLADDDLVRSELDELAKAARDKRLVLTWVLAGECAYPTTPLVEYMAAHDLTRPLNSLTPTERDEIWSKLVRSLERKLGGIAV